MKADMIEYMSVLSEKDCNILEDLLSNKYRKFVKLFALMKDYTDTMEKMKYNFSDKHTLDVDIYFSKDTDITLKEEIIRSMEESGYKVESKITKKKVKLVIIYDEK